MGPSVWLIAGPTASGKSELALRLAETVGGEVVNADSMQLYADLRVLTARPLPEEEARAPHHLYGVADAAQGWSVGRWLGAAERVLREIAGRGRTAVVVGGTGLYFRALTEGLAAIPPVPAFARDEAAAELERLGEAAFRERLAACDPEAAARIQPGDRQRLVRAFSVARATGRPLFAWQGAAAPTFAARDYAAAVLDPPRPALYARCDARVRRMATEGGVEEAAALLARGLAPDLPAMKAIGVREFGEHAAGRAGLEAAIAAAQLQTRRYAKRQSTWFRNQTPALPRLEATEPGERWDALQRLLDNRQA